MPSAFHWFWLYAGRTGGIHWDGGTLLRIRRLGVRIPPSALKGPRHKVAGNVLSAGAASESSETR